MKNIPISHRAEEQILKNFPWVFSNEILCQLKEINVGDIVKIVNKKGKFLAYAYGNPHSLIALRILSLNEKSSIDENFLLNLLSNAESKRKFLNLHNFSHRVCFGESDFIPGLILDAYKNSNDTWDLVFQRGTRGIVSLIQNPKNFFVKFAMSQNWKLSKILEKLDSRGRKLENLEISENPEVFLCINDSPEEEGTYLLRSSSKPLRISLYHGQKTGLFLDQQDNLLAFKKFLQSWNFENYKMLDLFCYAGQWTHAALDCNPPKSSEFHMVDCSQKALEFARLNTQNSTFICNYHKADIIKEFENFPHRDFNIVICDPPALIPSKKDLKEGIRAYQKINTSALRLIKNGGLFVSASCSQHLSENDLLDLLKQSALKAGKSLTILCSGQQALDHPRWLHFQQSYYLKAYFAQVWDQ